MDVPIKGKRTALHLAAESGREPLVQLLLEQLNIAINPQDKKGRTPLHAAATVGSTESFHQLLRSGANWSLADTKGKTAIHNALFVSRTRGFVDKKKNNLLHIAVGANDPELVKVIIAHQPELATKQNNNGQTPIECAITQGDQFKILQILMKAGEK